MNYYIKVGKMYVYDIYVDSDCIKTEFIGRIEFKDVKDNCIKICEEQKEFYIDKISKILELYIDDNIHFEKVEEEERSDDLSIE